MRELVERHAAVVVAVVAALRIYSIQCEQQTVNKHEQQPPLNHCCSVPDNSSSMCSKCTYHYCLLYLYNRIDVRTRRTHCTHAYEYIVFGLPPACCCSYHSFACIFICCRRRRCVHSSITQDSGGRHQSQKWSRALELMSNRQWEFYWIFYSRQNCIQSIQPSDVVNRVAVVRVPSHLINNINNNLFVKCHFSHSMFVISLFLPNVDLRFPSGEKIASIPCHFLFVYSSIPLMFVRYRKRPWLIRIWVRKWIQIEFWLQKCGSDSKAEIFPRIRVMWSHFFPRSLNAIYGIWIIYVWTHFQCFQWWIK